MLIPLEELVAQYPISIQGVLHVGAHEGEENAAYLSQGVHQDNIYWIEAHPSLCYKLAERLPNVIQAVVSDKYEQATFNVTNNFQSSSILNLRDHLVAHPNVYVTDQLRMSTTTLDSIVRSNSIRANFLNMDIQGAELKCLQGFGDTISMIDYVYTEVNTKELYSGCALLQDIDTWLGSRGFERKAISMTPYGWGDAFYIRRSLLPTSTT